MTQFLGMGTGSDGDLNITVDTTDSPIDSVCSGTSGTKSLTASNPSFSANQYILIHQTQGTGAGQWELNQIASYVAGTITTLNNLDYTYGTGAQVLVVKQYRNITIDVGVTWTAKAWGGVSTKGGILAFMATGNLTKNGNINGAEKGFIGGVGVGASSSPAKCGEGTLGGSANQQAANGNGGGGGASSGSPSTSRAGGAGGGHSSVGQNGQNNQGYSGNGGIGGGISGSSDLTNMTFGGAGGAGIGDGGGSTGGNGGNSGGIIAGWIAGQILGSGTISVKGGHGNARIGGSNQATDGGAGAGGSIYLVVGTGALGSTLVIAQNEGAEYSGIGGGGASSYGRINVSGCSVTGTTDPTMNAIIGGQSFCSAPSSML